MLKVAALQAGRPVVPRAERQVVPRAERQAVQPVELQVEQPAEALQVVLLAVRPVLVRLVLQEPRVLREQ